MAATAPIVNSAELSASGKSAPFLNQEQSARETGNAVVLPTQDREQEHPKSNVRVEILLPAYAPNPRPSRVFFGGLQDPGLQVVRAIPLDVSVEESTVVACWSEIDEFGTGDTLSAALDDFAGATRELYHRLFAPDVTLGADLQRVKETVGQYIQPRK